MAEIKNLYDGQGQGTNPLDLVGSLAAGRAIQDSLDDQGNVDQGKFSGLIKQGGPMAALHAIPTLTAIQQLRQAGHITDQEAANAETAQGTAQLQKADIWQKRWGMMDAVAYPLRGKKDLTRKDIFDAAASLLTQPEAVRLGITMPMIMENIVNKMPKGKDGQPPSSAELGSWLDRQHGIVLGAAERMGAYSPQVQYVDDGGTLRPKDINPRSPTFGKTIAPNVAKQVDPGTQVFPEGGGAPEYAGGRGENEPFTDINPAAGQGGAQGAPAAQSGSVTEQTAPNTSSKPLKAANPPGFNEASNSEAANSADMGNELTKAADSSPQRKALLGNLKDLSKKFDSGPGADLIRAGKSFANARTGVNLFDPKTIAAQDEFKKQSVQLAQQQFAAIGGTGTDAKFNSAYETSPNETLSNMSNEGIISLLQGNEDALNAKFDEWRAWRKAGHGPNTGPEFQQQFNKSFDPRVFQFKYLSPESRQQYLDNMDNDDDRRKFLRDIKAAKLRGWVTFEQPKDKEKK